MSLFARLREISSTTGVARMTTRLFHRLDSWLEGRKVNFEDKPSSSHPSTLSETIKMNEESSEDFSKPRRVDYHSNWKEIKMLYVG